MSYKLAEGYRRLPDEGYLEPKRIYDWPCRTWHWTNAVLVVVLMISGYLIGKPLPSLSGDPSTLYVMGWVRFVHLAAGQMFAVAFLFRIYWGFMGNKYSGQLFFPAFWRKTWTDGFVEQVKWNLFLRKKAPRYIGLNPLANVLMLFMLVIPTVLIILTGFAMLAQVSGSSSWQFAAFGWMISIFGNTLDLHVVHRLCMWVILCFFIGHVYITWREDIIGRHTVMSSMMSGLRMYRE